MKGHGCFTKISPEIFLFLLCLYFYIVEIEVSQLLNYFLSKCKNNDEKSTFKLFSNAIESSCEFSHFCFCVNFCKALKMGFVKNTFQNKIEKMAVEVFMCANLRIHDSCKDGCCSCKNRISFL